MEEKKKPGTEYFKHGIYSPFFFCSKRSLFHNSSVFGSGFIHILYTGCVKIKKKNNSGAKRLNFTLTSKSFLERLTTFLLCNYLKFKCYSEFCPKGSQVR